MTEKSESKMKVRNEIAPAEVAQSPPPGRYYAPEQLELFDNLPEHRNP